MNKLRVVQYSDHFFHRFPTGLSRYGHRLFEEMRGQHDLAIRPVGVWTNLDSGAVARLRDDTGATLLRGGRRPWLLSWHFLGAPRLESVVDDFDLLHICAPGVRVPTRRPTVVTIHDIGLLTHPEFFSAQYPWLFRRHMRDIVERKARVICVSNHTAAEFRRVLSTDLAIDVIHEGIAEIFLKPPEVTLVEELRQRIGRPFFLTAGSIQPRKNLLRTCRAFAGLLDEIPHSLVFVGPRGWDDAELWKEIRSPRLRDRVHFLGFVDDRELCALYHTAEAFIFVSLFEGFGLPAAEAMGAGCPVIAANTTSLPEVVGDAGILTDPTDIGAIAGAMRKLAKDVGARSELRARGQERARLFSWSKAAEATSAVYRAVSAGA